MLALRACLLACLRVLHAAEAPNLVRSHSVRSSSLPCLTGACVCLYADAGTARVHATAPRLLPPDAGGGGGDDAGAGCSWSGGGGSAGGCRGGTARAAAATARCGGWQGQVRHVLHAVALQCCKIKDKVQISRGCAFERLLHRRLPETDESSANLLASDAGARQPLLAPPPWTPTAAALWHSTACARRGPPALGIWCRQRCGAAAPPARTAPSSPSKRRRCYPPASAVQVLLLLCWQAGLHAERRAGSARREPPPTGVRQPAPRQRRLQPGLPLSPSSSRAMPDGLTWHSGEVR